MADVDYSRPIVLETSETADKDPRPCPHCGKARNYNFIPFCTCRAITLKPIVDEVK